MKRTSTLPEWTPLVSAAKEPLRLLASTHEVWKQVVFGARLFTVNHPPAPPWLNSFAAMFIQNFQGYFVVHFFTEMATKSMAR